MSIGNNVNSIWQIIIMAFRLSYLEIQPNGCSSVYNSPAVSFCWLEELQENHFPLLLSRKTILKPVLRDTFL
jgi:hypothetical protein